MSEVAVKVEGLTKSYQLATRAAVYRTLRETLTTKVGSWLSGNGHSAGSDLLWALKDVSFEVRQGEIVGIVGRNGAGKSTLLKVLSRITAPTSGYAEIHGRVGALLEIGTGFHPELTGRENIYLNGAILGMRKTTVDRKFDEMVSFAELEQFLDTPVKHYSSGMYMRLAFAVAAHLDPEILLIDEVLAVGDFAFQKKCLGKMGEVARQGRTVLFVSHNLAAIAALTNRTILLQKGQRVCDGPTQEVLQRYLLSQEPHDQIAGLANEHLKLHGIRFSAGAEADADPAAFLAIQGEPLRFELDVSVISAVRRAAFVLNIIDLRDYVIYTGMSSDGNDWMDLDPGRRKITHVVKLPLSPGAYQISFGLCAEGRGTLAEFNRFVHFQMIQRADDSRVYDNRPGVVRINGEWRVE